MAGRGLTTTLAPIGRRAKRLEARMQEVRQKRLDAAGAAVDGGCGTARELRMLYTSDEDKRGFDRVIEDEANRLDQALLPAHDTTEFADLWPLVWAALIRTEPSTSPVSIRAREYLTSTAAHRPPCKYPLRHRYDRWVAATYLALHLGLLPSD